MPPITVILGDGGRLEAVRLVVYGLPGPQGSKRFVGRTKSGRGRLVESSKKVKPWREAVVYAARTLLEQHGEPVAMDGPLAYRMTFTLPKPGSAPKRRVTFPDRMPDGSKLLRSTEDALTDAGVWVDDARVVDGAFSKRYPGEGTFALPVPGVVIEVATLAAWEGLFGPFAGR